MTRASKSQGPSRHGPLQAEFDRVVRETPREAFKQFLAVKLETLGVTPKPALVEAMTKHILEGGDETFTWDESDPREIVVNFTSEDFDGFRAMMKELAAQTPAMIEKLRVDLTSGTMDEVRRTGPARASKERAEEAAFRKRLLLRWGESIGQLRIMITMASEFGDDVIDQHATEEEAAWVETVLVRLHARGCQIAREILALLENGYADGAMGRWRTLYEVGVTAALISDWGAEAARRYMAHDHVESWQALKAYEECAPGLDLPPPPPREKAEVDANYKAVLKQYGEDFGTGYGWAGAFLTNKRPSFRDLEVAAQRSALRAHYKLASFNVHGGVKGITYRLGAMGDKEILLAGASNAGLGDPCVRTARDLAALTALIYRGELNLDEIVRLHCLMQMADRIQDAAGEAERILQRDERLRHQPRGAWLRKWSWRRARRTIAYLMQRWRGAGPYARSR